MAEDSSATELMSKGDFARLIGVTPARVSQYIAAGQLSGDALEGVGRRAMIKVSVALAELRNVLDATRLLAEEGNSTVRAGVTSKLTEHKADRESYLARMAELDYLERVGQLLDVDDVTRAMERCAEVIVRDVDRLPTLADELASVFEREGVQGLRRVLKGASNDMRIRLAETMRRLGESDDDEGGARSEH